MKNIFFFILLFCASFSAFAQRGNTGGQQSNIMQVFPNCVQNILPRNNSTPLRNTLAYTCSDSSVYYIDSKGVSIKMGRANGSGLAFVTTDNVTTEGNGTALNPISVKEIPLSLITQSFAQNGMVPVWDSILGIWAAKHISYTPDKDFLRVLNNGLPTATGINDTLYRKGMTVLGGRKNWINNTLVVIDSVNILGANIGISGERAARIGFQRYLDGKYSSIGQEGSNMSVRLGDDTDGFAVEKYTSGTDHTNGLLPKRIAYFDGRDSTVIFTGYGNVNDASNSPLIATWGTDGKLRSDLITEFKPLLKDTQSLSLVGSTLSLSGGGGSISLPSGGGSAKVYKYDNYLLPGIYEKINALGLTANESVTNYSYNTVDILNVPFSATAYGATSTEFGGWLANGASGDSITVTAPFMVVIGDSQAEGHPAKHGPLHVGGASTFTPNYPNQSGTLGYYLNRLTKMPVYNRGIGSQSTAQILARFDRDVLAKTFDPGDGRGSKTLQRKPKIAVIIGGINDVFLGVQNATIAENLEKMAQKCRDNGIQAVFFNCPGDELCTQNQLKKIDSLNNYFNSGVLQSFGAAVFDYNKWWKGGENGDNLNGNSLIVDDVHPSQVGYDSLAHVLFREINLPVLDSVTFYTKIKPGFAGYSRPQNITIGGTSYVISGEKSTIPLIGFFEWDSVAVKINTSLNVSGTTYSGFNHVEWHYKNDTTNTVSKKYANYNGYNLGGSYFTKSGSNIYPNNATDKLIIGATSPFTATTLLTVKSPLNTGNVITDISSSSQSIFKVTDNNRINIGGSSGAYPLNVLGAAQFQLSGSPTQYTYISGPNYQIFGVTPTIGFQSTQVNTGGSGFTETNLNYNGNDLFFTNTGSRAKNGTYSWYSKLNLPVFRVDLANEKAEVQSDSLNNSFSNTSGLFSTNPTASTSILAQNSPPLILRSSTWNSAIPVSRVFDARIYAVGGIGSGGYGYIDIGTAINNVYVPNQLTVSSTGNIGINTVAARVGMEINKTDAIQIPSGTTAQRPTAPTAGDIRHNSTTNEYEGAISGTFYSFARVSKATANLDFPATTGPLPETVVMTVPGAVVGDVVVISPTTTWAGTALLLSGYVSGVNQVTVQLTNMSGVSVDLPSQNFNATVIKF